MLFTGCPLPQRATLTMLRRTGSVIETRRISGTAMAQRCGIARQVHIPFVNLPLRCEPRSMSSTSIMMCAVLAATVGSLTRQDRESFVRVQYIFPRLWRSCACFRSRNWAQTSHASQVRQFWKGDSRRNYSGRSKHMGHRDGAQDTDHHAFRSAFRSMACAVLTWFPFPEHNLIPSLDVCRSSFLCSTY